MKTLSKPFKLMESQLCSFSINIKLACIPEFECSWINSESCAMLIWVIHVQNNLSFKRSKHQLEPFIYVIIMSCFSCLVDEVCRQVCFWIIIKCSNHVLSIHIKSVFFKCTASILFNFQLWLDSSTSLSPHAAMC